MGTVVANTLTERWAIHRSWLLAIYLVVPVCVLVALVDMGLFSGALQAALPSSPQDLWWFQLVFVTPHILASSVTFLDREYIEAYGGRLWRSIGIAVAVALLLPAFGPMWLFLVVNGVWTVWHVMGQQLGLASPIAGVGGAWHSAWKWVGLLAASATFVLVFIDKAPWVPPGLVLMATVLVLGFSALTFRLHQQAATGLGRTYLWSNVVLVVLTLVFIQWGYPFFAILAVRVVHDITAFVFYVVHDHNRNVDGAHNLVYAALGRVMAHPGRYALWITPLVAMLVAGVLRSSLTPHLLNVFVLLHYLTESYCWKGYSPHRKQLEWA